MDPKPPEEQSDSKSRSLLAGIAPELSDADRGSPPPSPWSLDAWNERRAAKESQKLDLDLKRVKLRQERARAREMEASADKRKAEALEAAHRANKEPARQTQALSAGWVRIGLTVIVAALTIALLVVGYIANPLAYPAAVLSSLGLYPLRPWEFAFSPTAAESEPD
jgi:hypothetical protein